MILVDTNVLLDLVTGDPVWAMWSIEQLESAAIKSPVLINDVISAELAARYGTIEKLNAFAADARLIHVSMPKSALFLRVSYSRDTAGPADSEVGFFRISSSARMLLSKAFHFSLEIQVAIDATSQNCV